MEAFSIAIVLHAMKIAALAHRSRSARASQTQL
jgi:hypothetical protein